MHLYQTTQFHPRLEHDGGLIGPPHPLAFVLSGNSLEVFLNCSLDVSSRFQS